MQYSNDQVEKFEVELSNFIDRKYAKWFQRESSKNGIDLSIKNYYALLIEPRNKGIVLNTNGYGLPQIIHQDCYRIFLNYFPFSQ